MLITNNNNDNDVATNTNTNANTLYLIEAVEINVGLPRTLRRFFLPNDLQLGFDHLGNG